MKVGAKHPKEIKITCPYCQGCGQVNLSRVYRETLECLRAQRSEVSGAALARAMGVANATAVNNRLVRLERLGLATSRLDGRCRFFAAVPARLLRSEAREGGAA